MATPKGKRGFALLEALIVAAIIGLFAAIAIPAYLRYLTSSAQGTAVANFESAVRACRDEQSKRALHQSNLSPNLIATVLDPAGNKPSPLNASAPAFVAGAAGTADGQVAIDVVDFTYAASPPGTLVTIAVDTSSDGAWAADQTETLTLNP
jgi:prepilin-type N-terminal cleavage/methylation domain-containing protein